MFLYQCGAGKIQKAIEIACSVEELSKINHEVKSILEIVIKKEMFLQSKLEETLKLAGGVKERANHKRKSIGDETS
jgi:hypothetical protein